MIEEVSKVSFSYPLRKGFKRMCDLFLDFVFQRFCRNIYEIVSGIYDRMDDIVSQIEKISVDVEELHVRQKQDILPWLDNIQKRQEKDLIPWLNNLQKEREADAIGHSKAIQSLEQRIMKLVDELRVRQKQDILPWLENVSKSIDEELRPLLMDTCKKTNRCYDDRYGELGVNYFDWENYFRGSEEIVKKRFEVYVKHFKSGGRILDGACGRGEMSEVLKERGFSVVGIDLCHEMVKYCQSKGLDVAESDLIDYLEKLDNDSLDGIFLGQVVEHLGGRYFIKLLRLCKQKLKKGGVLLVETLNPQMPAIFGGPYYMDFTHIFPIHPLVIDYLLKSEGWSESMMVDTSHPELDYAWKGVK